ncbi:MAG: glycosyltransferase family 2 protein [Elusimicrobiota bacterium]
MGGLQVSAVVPAFNEEDGIAQVVEGLDLALKRGCDSYEIIVVDDGSTDRTEEMARFESVRVIKHPINRGCGRALLTGIGAARHDWVLMIDGDGSYPPEEAGKLLPRAPEFDMVIGARQGKLFWGNPLQAWMRWIYLWIAGFVAGEPIPDANSGLRLFRKEAYLRTVPFLCFGYSFKTTMTLSFIQSGNFVAFEPIRLEERKGRSKVRIVRDILRTLQIMLQIILYYDPLKFVACLSLVPAGFALLFALRYLSGRAFGDLAMLAASALSGLLVFLVGCVLDSQRRRQRSLP